MKTNKYCQVLLSFTLAIFLVIIIPALAASQNQTNDSNANIPSIESLKEKCAEIENRGFPSNNQQPNTKTICEEIEKLNFLRDQTRDKKRDKFIGGTRLALGIYFAFGFLFFSYSVIVPICNKNYDISVNTHWMLSLLIREYRAIVLIPISVGIAILVVLMLEQTAGQIQLSFGDLKFEGASGPIIFWILCFAILVFGLNLLWVGDRAKKDD